MRTDSAYMYQRLYTIYTQSVGAICMPLFLHPPAPMNWENKRSFDFINTFESE